MVSLIFTHHVRSTREGSVFVGILLSEGGGGQSPGPKSEVGSSSRSRVAGVSSKVE